MVNDERGQSCSQSFVPLDQRSENEISGSIHFRHASKHAIDADQNSVISYSYFKMAAPRTLVFRPLVKEDEALGTRLGARSLATCAETEKISFSSVAEQICFCSKGLKRNPVLRFYGE